ncbi:hypothetical protein [Streptomyces mutabilis]
MSAAAANRVGRFYTTARRHPWVLGKVADWKIPLGPYTPAQIAVLVGGGFLLIKTISWWSWMGPVPVVAWVLAVWAVRRPKVKGRAPLQAALSWLFLAWQPQGGRTGGRAARDRAARERARVHQRQSVRRLLTGFACVPDKHLAKGADGHAQRTRHEQPQGEALQAGIQEEHTAHQERCYRSRR